MHTACSLPNREMSLSGEVSVRGGLCPGRSLSAVADPGFPRGGVPTPQGAPTYDFAKFSQKLHEIERISTRGGRASLTPPLDPPLVRRSLSPTESPLVKRMTKTGLSKHYLAPNFVAGGKNKLDTRVLCVIIH